MPSAVLLYNPHAGQHPQKRLRILEGVAQALRQRHVETTLVPTAAPGTAGQQAAALRADIIFACGGDGTVHEVLQGMVHHPTAALGILPVGTANILAKDLRLPADPVAAALAQVDYQARTVPMGLLRYVSPHGPEQRYFLVMAGAGPDGEVVRESMRDLKLRAGPLAYYLRSARLYFMARFPVCTASLQLLSGEVIDRRTQGIMAFRVGSMGGVFGPRTPRGALDHPHLEVTILKPPVRLSMLAWLLRGWLPLPGLSRLVECFQVSSVTASAGSRGDVQVQADGEWLGRAPMELKVVENAVRMLLPTASHESYLKP